MFDLGTPFKIQQEHKWDPTSTKRLQNVIKNAKDGVPKTCPWKRSCFQDRFWTLGAPFSHISLKKVADINRVLMDFQRTDTQKQTQPWLSNCSAASGTARAICFIRYVKIKTICWHPICENKVVSHESKRNTHKHKRFSMLFKPSQNCLEYVSTPFTKNK